MGKAVSVWVMGVALVLLGALAMVGAMQEAYAPVNSGVSDKPCVELLPHADMVSGEEWNAWVSSVVERTHAVNVEYDRGVWYADGVTVGYGVTEDSAIYNYAECVR